MYQYSKEQTSSKAAEITAVQYLPSASDPVKDLRVVSMHTGSTCLCELEEEAQRKITAQLLSSQGLVLSLLTSLGTS